MKKITDRDMEQLLHGAAFPNPAHKDALHARLFDGAKELDLDDLALVAGGSSLPDQEAWIPWPEANVQPEKR